MLKIGEFSKLSKVSIRMLRHYNEIGLLIPETIDNFTNYRYYSETQLPLVNRISALKDMGFSLSSITTILKNYKDTQELKQYLLLKQTELQELAEETNYRLLLIKNFMNRLGKDMKIMEYSVTLKELPQRYVASVRKIIPSYQEEGVLWKTLMEETQMLPIQDAVPCYTLAVFHDKEYKETDVDVEVQKSVVGNYKDTKNVKFKTIPPILMASATYTGSYELITEVNEAVAQWVKDNNYSFNGESFSIYHVSPHEESNPDNYVTEVCYPIKKK